ncbi:hypothetical protein [Mesorhizobium captivum]|uniref:hypothetical protein n=1 Tax=Mesorhizobium captivum TaxID=3072319 RepID=UPI002A242E0D|nr:hypothetical protein [Mesorhizobium sp. VK22E]MDX8509788.1 hypothetical protein [Mesorhizobium sp. VK22E]
MTFAAPLVSMLLVLDTGVDGWADNASADEIGDLILSLDPTLELARAAMLFTALSASDRCDGRLQ